jgi:hypothetical protein
MSQVPTGFAYAAVLAALTGETVRCGLLVGTTTTPFDPDRRFVADIVADEASGTGYARVIVTGVTVTRNTTSDEIEIDGDDAVFPDLDADNGPITGVFYYYEVTNDADHVIIVTHDISSITEADRTPDGTDFIIRPGSVGFAKATV